MKVNRLAVYLQDLEKTSSRLEITSILAKLFTFTDRKEIAKVCYLILGSLAPTYKNIVFNMADKLLLQAISKSYGIDLSTVKKTYKEIGDVGETVYFASTKLNSPQIVNKYRQKDGLTVLNVYDMLVEIADEQGDDSVDRKITKTSELLSGLDSLSAKYVSRIILGKLRLGFSEKTIIDALSWMETNGKEKSKLIEEAYNVLPDIGLMAERIKEKGIEEAAKNISPVVGIPVLPALAQRLKSPREMVEKMKLVGIEPKFDGLRIQIHYKRTKNLILKTKNRKSEKIPNSKFLIHNSDVKAFTRNMNETSWMFPELKNIGEYLNADEVILDSEAVGVDEKRKTLVNFQTTMTRRRKYEIEEISKKVGIKFYVFDCLFKDSSSLMNAKYEERKSILKNIIKPKGCLQYVDHIITDDDKMIEKEMKRNLKEGMEGVVVKRADSTYVSGRTGWRWVKMKEEEDAKAKLSDTIDCVVMGYYRGKGKRTGFGIGGFLVGIRNYELGIKNKAKKKEWEQETEKILTLTKIGTGLTDEQFRDMNRRLEKIKSDKKPSEYETVNKLHTPDIWVEPELVVEIAADEITKSPSHSSGYALRFPRLVRIRDDKSVDQATSAEEIKEMLGR